MYTDADTSAPASPGAAECSDVLLLQSARLGDGAARQMLYARCLPVLRRWARAWLPRECIGVNDADDLVQTVLLRALNRLDDFEPRGDACFLAYLRQILLNEVRGELRRQRRRGETVEVDDSFALEGDPVVEDALRSEREHAYATALRQLNPRQQQHLTLRLHDGLSFGEIARQVGGSADGARMMVARAMRVISDYIAVAA